MIRVFHGDDEFSIDGAVRRIRESVGEPDFREPNTSVFEGRVKPGEVMAVAMATPFLAVRRVVIVKGILTKVSGGEKDANANWKEFGRDIDQVAPTTELVFVEAERLKPGSPGLRLVGPQAEIREFVAPKGDLLMSWLRARITELGGRASTDAVNRLAWLAGQNLRLLDQEARKLVLYCSGREISKTDVDDLVPEARAESIFAAVDAIVERRPGVAVRLLYSQLESGTSSSDIVSRLASQVRAVILAKELVRQGVSPEEVGRRLAIKSRYPLEKTLKQAGTSSMAYLTVVHRRLLAADMAMKTGQIDDRMAIELMVAELTA